MREQRFLQRKSIIVESNRLGIPKPTNDWQLNNIPTGGCVSAQKNALLSCSRYILPQFPQLL
jgi:hypothetical protein